MNEGVEITVNRGSTRQEEVMPAIPLKFWPVYLIIHSLLYVPVFVIVIGGTDLITASIGVNWSEVIPFSFYFMILVTYGLFQAGFNYILVTYIFHFLGFVFVSWLYYLLFQDYSFKWDVLATMRFWIQFVRYVLSIAMVLPLYLIVASTIL